MTIKVTKNTTNTEMDVYGRTVLVGESTHTFTEPTTGKVTVTENATGSVVIYQLAFNQFVKSSDSSAIATTLAGLIEYIVPNEAVSVKNLLEGLSEADRLDATKLSNFKAAADAAGVGGEGGLDLVWDFELAEPKTYTAPDTISTQNHICLEKFGAYTPPTGATLSNVRLYVEFEIIVPSTAQNGMRLFEIPFSTQARVDALTTGTSYDYASGGGATLEPLIYCIDDNNYDVVYKGSMLAYHNTSVAGSPIQYETTYHQREYDSSDKLIVHKDEGGLYPDGSGGYPNYNDLNTPLQVMLYLANEGSVINVGDELLTIKKLRWKAMIYGDSDYAKIPKISQYDQKLINRNNYNPDRVPYVDPTGKMQTSSVTKAELEILDGNSTNTNVTPADDDKIIINDGGTMKQTVFSKLFDYVKGKFNGAISTVLTSNLTANKAIVTNSSGKVATSATTSAEIATLTGSTTRGTNEVTDGDGFIHNDGGVIRQTKVEKLAEYVSSKSAGGGLRVTYQGKIQQNGTVEAAIVGTFTCERTGTGSYYINGMNIADTNKAMVVVNTFGVRQTAYWIATSSQVSVNTYFSSIASDSGFMFTVLEWD